MGKTRIEVAPGAWFFWALLLLVLPINWLAAAVCAAAVHELCHIGAVKLWGGEITRFSIGTAGAVLEAAPMSRGKNLFCTLAGPLGGGLLVLLMPRFPRLALCALVQTVFNLLPVLPLDGGRVAGMLLSPRGSRVLGMLTGAAVLGFGLWAAKLGLGVMAIFPGAILLLKNVLQKKEFGVTMEKQK